MKLFRFLNIWHALAYITALIICIMSIIWEWQGAPLHVGGTLLVLKIIPLALCLIGLWRANLYIMQVVSMLILLYMAEGVVRGMGDRGVSVYYAWAEFILSWICFLGCILHIRPYKKIFKQNLKKV